MIGKLDEAFRFHETALSLRAQRQQLLASNIANADTPHYKARDVDFGKALQNAMSGSSANPAPVAVVKTAASHLSPQGAPTIGGLEPQYRSTIQGSVDGNTVDMDMERNQFTDNALRYEAGITLMSGEIKKMLTAIQGQ
ncbi:flagellar basal body rod protein FlgB [Noviherbaspirillum cavernae]|uniref:Flagellar basal body rod protein FlgB n=1 Tax=Noviherbaspirillum cavernae TaxID=2320862 RepID=A0A418X0A4_9BURK|nr:flagellar basal body rod protein FlgB [Noviherbaspirillum cavernae]RJG05934.1 flagellar basal body rod protein FlgB [Noviherbaspirillum cavernae]